MGNVFKNHLITRLPLKRPLFVCLVSIMSSLSHAECTEEDLAQRKASLQAYLLEITTMDAATLEQLPSFSYALECEQTGENSTYTLNTDAIALLEQVNDPAEMDQLLGDHTELLSETLSAALGNGSAQSVDVPQLQTMLNDYVESSNIDMEALKQQADSLGVSSELVSSMLENMTAHEKWDALLPKR